MIEPCWPFILNNKSRAPLSINVWRFSVPTSGSMLSASSSKARKLSASGALIGLSPKNGNKSTPKTCLKAVKNLIASASVPL